MVDLEIRVSHEGDGRWDRKRLRKAFVGGDGFVYDSAISGWMKKALDSHESEIRPQSNEKKAVPTGSRPGGFRSRLDKDWIHDLDPLVKLNMSHEREESRNQRKAKESTPKNELTDRSKKAKSFERILELLRGNFPNNNSDSENSSRSSNTRRNPLIRQRHVLFKKKRRQANVFDAAAGLISARPRYTRGKYGRWKPPRTIKDKLRSLPYAPDEVLFQRSRFPLRQAEQDLYFANEQKLHNGGEGILPDSDLLKVLHAFASRFYASHRPPSWKYRKVDMASMDATALLAFGILMEELAKDVARKGYRVLTEGRAKVTTAVGSETYDSLVDETISLISQHRSKRQRLEDDLPKLESDDGDDIGSKQASKAIRQARDPFSSQIQKQLLHYRKLKPIDGTRQRVGTRDSLYGMTGRPGSLAALPRINFSPEKEASRRRSRRHNKRKEDDPALEAVSPTLPQFASVLVISSDDSDQDMSASDEDSDRASPADLPEVETDVQYQGQRQASVELGGYSDTTTRERHSAEEQSDQPGTTNPETASSTKSSEVDSDDG